MKKLLLIAATSATILSSTASFADDGEFYVKAAVGASIFNKVTDKTTFTSPAGVSASTALKMKSTTVFIGEIGVGTNIMDNVRTDVTFAMPVNPQFKKSANLSNGTPASIKHKAQIMSLFVNAYVDLFDVSITKMFVGAGAGVGAIKEKVSGTIAGFTTPSISTKRKYNFAYQVTAGVATEVAPGVKAELTYSWRDLGKSKTKTITGNGSTISAGNTRYKGHNVMVGVRVDI